MAEISLVNSDQKALVLGELMDKVETNSLPGENNRDDTTAASMPLSVWIVTGWFGDTEWYEPYAYLHKDEAQAACDELWLTRNSENGPAHARGLHKFSVEELAIIG